MNVTKDIFENKWEQIRAQSKAWWSLFSEDDLNKMEKAPVKRDKYAMMLPAGEILLLPRTRQGGNR